MKSIFKLEAKMNKLYVHIGFNKTGTTSIQTMFAQNFERFIEFGFYYPMSCRDGSGHHNFATSLSRETVDAGLYDDPANVILRNDMLREIEKNIIKTNVLISSEVFTGCDPALVNKILKPFDPTYIVYIREQVGHIISSYVEIIRSTASTSTFEDYVEDMLDVNRNSGYDIFLQIWSETVGEENLKVGVYDRRSLFQGDVVKDFLKLLGVSGVAFDVLNFPVAEEQNQSAGASLTEFKRLLNVAKEPNSHELRAVLTKLILRSTDKRPVVDESSYLKVVRRYEEGNKLVNMRYYGGGAVLQIPPYSASAYKSFPQLDLPTIREYICQLRAVYPRLVNTSAEHLSQAYNACRT